MVENKIKEDLIMALRINTNVAALNAHRQLLGTEAKMNSSMAKLSSGYRINTAGDDAAGLVQANRLRADVKALTVAAQNTIQGKANLSVAEGNANQIEGILERMKELANKGTSTETDAEFVKMKDEIDRIAGSAGAAAQTFSIQVGADATTYSQVSVSVGAMNIAALSLTAITTAGTTALTAVTTAIDTIGGILGNIGAGMNRLDYTYSNLQAQIENYSASESAIRDVDMASEMVSFTKSQILMQAGTAMLAQANTSNQNVLSLFR
jgi:flagellin